MSVSPRERQKKLSRWTEPPEIKSILISAGSIGLGGEKDQPDISSVMLKLRAIDDLTTARDVGEAG
jgi:hypothetical protein